MTAFAFAALQPPFPRWMGPYSPTRGTRSGFRFHGRRFGTWVGDESGATFWPVVENNGTRSLTEIVREHWGGGRVLLLCNGFAIKPLQTDAEVGRRVVIGVFGGSIVLEPPGRTRFDLGHPGNLRPGDRWPGPTTTGLECAIQPDGSLVCGWFHPTPAGRDVVRSRLRQPDPRLAAAFRTARPEATGGRVRITANGHVITNHQESDGGWACLYVGFVARDSWQGWETWIEKE